MSKYFFYSIYSLIYSMKFGHTFLRQLSNLFGSFKPIIAVNIILKPVKQLSQIQVKTGRSMLLRLFIWIYIYMGWGTSYDIVLLTGTPPPTVSSLSSPLQAHFSCPLKSPLYMQLVSHHTHQ